MVLKPLGGLESEENVSVTRGRRPEGGPNLPRQRESQSDIKSRICGPASVSSCGSGTSIVGRVLDCATREYYSRTTVGC